MYFIPDDEFSETNPTAEPTDDDAETTDYPRPKKRKMADKLLEELSKERSERFQLLKALTVDTQTVAKRSPPESPVHSFFKSMADVVSSFPPYMIAETRMEVCNLVTRMELRNEAQKGAIPGIAKVRIPGKANLANVVVKSTVHPIEKNRVQNEVHKSPLVKQNVEEKNVTFTTDALEG